MSKMTVIDYRKGLQLIVQRLGLGNFLDWWLGELSAMYRQIVPGTSHTAMERWVLVKINGSLVTFSRVVHEKATEVGRLDMASLDANGQKQAFQSELDRIARKGVVALYLPQEQVLCKKLFLPLAAEENLRQVIAFEMDRHTPFHAGQVYFDYRLAHRGKQLEIILAVAPRDAIDEPLRQLAAWGVRATAALVPGEAPADTPWNLLPDELRQKGGGMRRRLDTILAIGIAALFCAALALPIWQKRETVLALRPLQDKARERAEASENLRRQLETLVAEYNYLLDKKRSSPPVVAVLEDVTRILPDDTWVQRFELRGKEMHIHGETASSSKLAGLFEQAKTLHDASFKAPLTKGQGANSERFQLAAGTKPLPRAETEPQSSAPVQPSELRPDVQHAPDQTAAPDGADTTDTPAIPEDGGADMRPALSEATNSDNQPAAAETVVKPNSAQAARTRRRQ